MSYKRLLMRTPVSTIIKKTNDYRKWIFKGGLGVLDQVFYSGTNFVVSVLLARWLSATQFGVFAFATAIFSLYYQLQNTLILEPMSVIGPAYYYDSLDGYLDRQRGLHFLLFIPIGLLVISLSLIFRLINIASDFQIILLILGLLTPLLQLPWFVRRRFYVKGKPEISVLYSFLYSVFFIFLIVVFYKADWLSADTSLVLMGFAAVSSSIVILLRRKIMVSLKLGSEIWETIKQNWRYGRWMLLSGVFIFLAGQAPIYLSGIMLTVEITGAVKALQNFTMPLIMIVSTLAAIAIPTISRFYAEMNVERIRVILRGIIAVSLVLTIMYEALLIVFSSQLEMLLYNGKYQDYVSIIPLWGLIPILMAAAIGGYIKLLAFQKPQGVLIVSIGWVVSALISGPLFIQWWGVKGAVLSSVLGYAISLILYLLIPGFMNVETRFMNKFKN